MIEFVFVNNICSVLDTLAALALQSYAELKLEQQLILVVVDRV